jgi:tRNA threonylcarbamoyladenosine biosynthesis protein TsaB
MIILALDTSGRVATAALMKDGALLYEVYLHHELTHSDVFLPMVDEALHAVCVSPGDVGLVACSVGPGSFTGLRIGVASARAIAHAAGACTMPVNTLDALYQNVCVYEGAVCVMMDARREQVYTARYAAGERISPYEALSLQEAVANAEDALYIGDGASVYRESIRSLQPGAVFAPPHLNFQRSSSVALCAQRAYAQGVRLGVDDLVPFYIRKPQAEREYERNMKA